MAGIGKRKAFLWEINPVFWPYAFSIFLQADKSPFIKCASSEFVHFGLQAAVLTRRPPLKATAEALRKRFSIESWARRVQLRAVRGPLIGKGWPLGSLPYLIRLLAYVCGAIWQPKFVLVPTINQRLFPNGPHWRMKAVFLSRQELILQAFDPSRNALRNGSWKKTHINRCFF